jgi:tripartite-type tricarboxylate transporter receptor subunit TctC
MKIPRRSFVSLAAGAAALTVLPRTAAAAPGGKTIRLIVPYAAGGPGDMLARAAAQGMSKALGQSIIIDNRSGASGLLGTNDIAKAPPDGATIGIAGVGTMAMQPFIRPAPYDARTAFAPITLIGRNPTVLVVSRKHGFKTVADLVAFAKAKPKTLLLASPGVGTTPHLTGVLFSSAAHVQLVHVPYARGVAPAVIDLLGGHVDMMFPDISGVYEQVRSGALVALAVTGEKRSPLLPNVPTMKEAGYPQVVSETWFGLVAPAKTPPATLNRLHAAAMTALHSPDVIKQIQLLGSAPAPMTQEQFRALIAAEQAKWKLVINTQGVKL